MRGHDLMGLKRRGPDPEEGEVARCILSRPTLGELWDWKCLLETLWVYSAVDDTPNQLTWLTSRSSRDARAADKTADLDPRIELLHEGGTELPKEPRDPRIAVEDTDEISFIRDQREALNLTTAELFTLSVLAREQAIQIAKEQRDLIVCGASRSEQ